jgi:hypothetical protein
MKTPQQLITEAAELLEQARILNTTQINEGELATMSTDDINKARKAGRLTDLLKGN